MKKSKKFMMMLPMIALCIVSCNDEEDVLNNYFSYKNVAQESISTFTYRNGNSYVKMLRFKGVVDYEQTLESLKEQQSTYEENFITTYMSTQKDSLSYVVYDEIGLDEDYIVKNFEKSLNFTNSMRKNYRQYEENWETNENIDTENSPMLKFPFCDENLSLVNSLGEVMIGDTIFKFTNDGYIAITDGSVETLIAYNNGDMSVLKQENVKTNPLYSGDCKNKKSNSTGYFASLHGAKILVLFTQKFACNNFGLASNGRSHAIVDTRILLKGKKGYKWYKVGGFTRKVTCKMYEVNAVCNKTNKNKTKTKSSKKYKLDVSCTMWHSSVNHFKVLNGASVYGGFSTLNVSDARYISW